MMKTLRQRFGSVCSLDANLERGTMTVTPILTATPVSSPSPLNGERAGVRGGNAQTHSFSQRDVGPCAPERALRIGGRLQRLGFRASDFGFASSAFSLIEIMVAITLLSLIMVGLVTVFNYTQRALRAAHNQTDVFEGARSAVDLIVQDMAAITKSGEQDGVNIYGSELYVATLPLPSGGNQTNIIQDVFALGRENDNWSGTGYFLDERVSGVGTLYRVSLDLPFADYATTTNLFRTFTNIAYNVELTNASVHRVIDGVTHFRITTFDVRGRIYTNWSGPNPTNITLAAYQDLTNHVTLANSWFEFRKDFLPAYVELEIGLLEPETTRKFNVIAEVNQPAADAFLKDNVGRMHLFRQRIPVRNHMKPQALD